MKVREIPTSYPATRHDPDTDPPQRWGSLASLVSYLQLARPVDTTMAAVGTLIGARLGGFGSESIPTIIGLACSNAMLCAASMMLNDWHDLAEDSINKPHRSIPSGRVTRTAALRLCWVLFAAAVAIATWLRPVLGLTALVIVLMSTVYTFKLKGIPLAGNLVVAFVSTYPIGCWSPLVTGGHATFILLTAACFVFRIGAELLKTAEDSVGDAECGIRTVATTLGAATANRIAAIVVCVSVAICWTALLLGRTNTLYTILVAVSTVLAIRLVVTMWPAGATPATHVNTGRLIMTPLAIAFAFGVGPG